MATLTCIPSTRAMNTLCKLLSDYKAGTDNRPTLAELKKELGEADYSAFNNDMAQLMRKMTAAKAVSEIISAAVARKQRAIADHGSNQV